MVESKEKSEKLKEGTEDVYHKIESGMSNVHIMTQMKIHFAKNIHLKL